MLPSPQLRRAARGRSAASQGGATAVAYAVMVAIIAMLLVAAVWALADQIGGAFTGGAECVANPGDCQPGGGGGAGGGGGGDGGGGGGSTSTTSTTQPPSSSITSAP